MCTCPAQLLGTIPISHTSLLSDLFPHNARKWTNVHGIQYSIKFLLSCLSRYDDLSHHAHSNCSVMEEWSIITILCKNKNKVTFYACKASENGTVYAHFISNISWITLVNHIISSYKHRQRESTPTWVKKCYLPKQTKRMEHGNFPDNGTSFAFEMPLFSSTYITDRTLKTQPNHFR